MIFFLASSACLPVKADDTGASTTLFYEIFEMQCEGAGDILAFDAPMTPPLFIQGWRMTLDDDGIWAAATAADVQLATQRAGSATCTGTEWLRVTYAVPVVE